MSLLPPREDQLQSTQGSTGHDEQIKQRRPSTIGKDLFPIPLAPIEQFLVLDDRPDCPMTSFIELHFASELQRDLLSQALTQTVHQHPFLASRLVTLDGEMHWNYDPDFEPQLRDPTLVPILATRDADHEPSPRPIDLRREPGCRYWYGVNEVTGKSCLTIQLHHAACDGVGLRRVIIDTLTAYAKLSTPPVEGEEPKKKKKRDQLDAKRLLARADFSEIDQKPVTHPISGWQRMKNNFYFYFLKPQPLVGTPVASSSSENNAPLRHHIFDVETSTKLTECCRKNEIAFNDLALTILFRACRHWNELHGLTKAKTRIRVLMPIDLRGRSDLQTPATNRLSFSFLGRTHSQCDDWVTLLSSVQKETNAIKSSRVYMDFLNGLATAVKHPKRFARAIGINRNMTTSVLTYTGDIARGMKNHFPEEDGRRKIGDSYLENILIAPPARENTNITMGLCINWGQICISANWNRTAITREECGEFLKIYASAMIEWLNTMSHESLGKSDMTADE
ncbi:hypothetical protein N9N28_02540 [Rubripirellula amarantea]|uniref:Peptide synthase n=1 Tax=Rubripirellula amarantea TaxID=2527999 RepID=A0A5C5WC45_9BACT|nr:hypothetical protein [Rubripirellula amarantea]MDA8743488.1 hypothetical protein [Rubripirellula amarantea]TWT48087.1 peptide synthase [Rubripirellula amarantea]